MKKTALILGGGDTLWSDLGKAHGFGRFDATLAINDAVAHYQGPIDYGVTLHPEKMPKWAKDRHEKGFKKPKHWVCHKAGKCPENDWVTFDMRKDYQWTDFSGSGSSGLFAVKTALEEGFNRIVLCGVPMTQTPHFWDKKPWDQWASFWEAWKHNKPKFKNEVRSFSGNTKELLGEPTLDWFVK